MEEVLRKTDELQTTTQEESLEKVEDEVEAGPLAWEKMLARGLLKTARELVRLA
jgi:hypothetical protein